MGERIVRGDDNRIGVLPSTCHTLLRMRILCVGIPVGLLAALTTVSVIIKFPFRNSFTIVNDHKTIAGRCNYDPPTIVFL